METVGYRVLGQSSGERLSPREHAMLPTGDGGHSLIRVHHSNIANHEDGFKPFTTNVR